MKRNHTHVSSEGADNNLALNSKTVEDNDPILLENKSAQEIWAELHREVYTIDWDLTLLSEAIIPKVSQELGKSVLNLVEDVAPSTPPSFNQFDLTRQIYYLGIKEGKLGILISEEEFCRRGLFTNYNVTHANYQSYLKGFIKGWEIHPEKYFYSLLSQQKKEMTIEELNQHFNELFKWKIWHLTFWQYAQYTKVCEQLKKTGIVTESDSRDQNAKVSEAQIPTSGSLGTFLSFFPSIKSKTPTSFADSASSSTHLTATVKKFKLQENFNNHFMHAPQTPAPSHSYLIPAPSIKRRRTE